MNIYDIAELAGVSASTVSRVVNNKPGIKPRTRELVQKLLEQHNYSPNENARGLVKQTSRILGILVPDIRDPYHAGSAYYIERELSAQGYCCILFNTGSKGQERAKHMQILRQRQVDGAVLIGSSYQSELVEKNIKEFLGHVPIIAANGEFSLPNVYSVLMDEKEGVMRLIRRLWKNGRRRFAFAASTRVTPGNTRKVEGFLEGLREAGAPGPHPMYPTEHSLEGGYATAQAIARKHPEVDAILFAWDLDAAGGLRGLLDMGKRVPEDIAVSGIDNSIYAEICRPKLTSVDIRQKEMCLAATKILLDLLEGKQTGPHIVRIPPAVVEREST